jgi:hypothetical protein
MSRPTLEVADVVRQYGAASLARYGSTVSPGAAPRPPGDRGLPDRRPGRARDAV